MDTNRATITLYTAQSAAVRRELEETGVCVCKEVYVRQKYGESAASFLFAYRWFANEAERLVQRPAGAELPYWAFADWYRVESSALQLEVPRNEAIFFDLYDWTRILQLRYLGESEEEEKAFGRELAARGIRESDVLLTPFYPNLRAVVLQSWQRLFRFHTAIQAGCCQGVRGVQAAIWQIKKYCVKN